MLTDKILGMDLGTRTIKVSLLNKGKSVEIKDMALRQTPEGSVFEGQIKEVEPIAALLKKMLADKKFGTKSLAVTINSPYAVVREFTVPALKDNEIAPAVEYDLSQTFPNIADTHYLSVKVYNRSAESVRGIVCFCPKKIVDDYYELAKKSGLKLKYVDVHANSIAKAFSTFITSQMPNDPVLVADIGFKSSQVIAMLGSKIILCRYFSGGGISVDNLVADHLKVPLDKAELYRKRGYAGLEISREEMDAYIRLGYAAIEEQMRQTIDFCTYNKFKNGIKHIFLMGGGSIFPGIEKYFTETFNIPATMIKPLDQKGINKDMFINMLPAIGSALRED